MLGALHVKRGKEEVELGGGGVRIGGNPPPPKKKRRKEEGTVAERGEDEDNVEEVYGKECEYGMEKRGNTGEIGQEERKS